MAFKDIPTVAESSHTDANQQFSLIGVQGTLGTSDVTGSAKTVPLGANPLTGALYVESTVSAGNPTAGTLNTIGTIGNLNNGSVNILTGTIQNSGSSTGVGVVSNLTNGSVNILTGTLQNSGSSTGVGVVSSLTNGSVNILTGTLQSSGTTTGVGVVTSVTNLVSGTLLNSGSSTGVGVVSNLTNGSVNILTGTVTRTSNIGTLESGTVKIDPTTIPQMVQFGTLGTAGGSFFGTISAASGAGTKHYIQGVDIVMQSAAGGQDVRVLAGSAIQGTGVLAAGFFGTPGGGIAKNWTPHFQTGTNSEILYHFVGAGTAFITVSYWKGV